MPLHKESLRQMMTKGLVDKEVGISVLKMLKSVGSLKKYKRYISHGDIKDILVPHSTYNRDYISEITS